MTVDAWDAVIQADQLKQLANDIKQELSRFKL